jgi:hypothetical protein
VDAFIEIREEEHKSYPHCSSHKGTDEATEQINPNCDERFEMQPLDRLPDFDEDSMDDEADEEADMEDEVPKPIN